MTLSGWFGAGHSQLDGGLELGTTYYHTVESTFVTSERGVTRSSGQFPPTPLRPTKSHIVHGV